MCEDLKKLISKVNYFSVYCLMAALIQLLLNKKRFVLFIREGTPVLKYLSIEKVKNANAPDLKSTLEVAFNLFGITHYWYLLK